MLQVTMDFVNFEPNPDLVSCVRRILNVLDSESPSDSARVARLKKTKEGQFVADIKISSRAGVFSAEVAAKDAQEAIEQIFSRLRGQLSAWKTQRSVF